jgi:glutamate N-acetyltransferase/amino-acid N-acetyltransferase
VADQICGSAGVFTQNTCRAAPVVWSSSRSFNGKAIMVNAGQANAQTGPDGLEDCQHSAKTLSRLLNIETDEVLLASTGVIGQPLNLKAMDQAIPKLVQKLSPFSLADFAQSILTTDTVIKMTQTKGAFVDGSEFKIWGAAKGSGMIAPNMATMLGFILTDAPLDSNLMHRLLKKGAEATFNRVTVDGDTSTNDCLLFLSSGATGRRPVTKEGQSPGFEEEFLVVLKTLARMIAKDGEGATRLVEVSVIGAKSSLQAKKAARTVAESPLVKTAFYGGDANWGRILAALGRSGADFDPYQVDLDLDDVPWVRNGQDNDKDKEASLVMKKPEYRLTINLKSGRSSYEMLTCDFSHEYVNINGSYRS